MKKVRILTVTALAACLFCGCGAGSLSQIGGQSTTTTANAGGALGNILGSVLGLDKMTQANLVGTWSYSQPGCAFTSEQLLAQAGGELAASQIKTKLQPTFQKVGISSANTQVTFNQDGTFAAKIAGKQWSGKYTFDESTGKVTMSTGISLLFEASKLLTLMQTMSAASGNSSSTLGTISDVAKNYNGLRVGFDMK